MPSVYRDRITPEAGAILDFVEAALSGRRPPTRHVPIGRRAEQPEAELRQYIRGEVMKEKPAPRTPAPDSDDPDSDIREEAWSRLSVEQREDAIKHGAAGEEAYRVAHAEVTAEVAEAAAAEEEEYYHSPTGGAMKAARARWAESRGR